MIRNEHTANFDITMKQGADYMMQIVFQADDDSEVTDYGVMVQGERIYIADGTDWEEETLYCAEQWGIEVPAERIFVTGRWKIAAQLREFAEDADCFEFQVGMTGDGFFLAMDHETTEKITYGHGVYDVFLIKDDGNRTKLLMGQANILREVTR